ncbi:MAG: polysaccharide deacetylase family protein [Gammaproteobacteria bacterium]
MNEPAERLPVLMYHRVGTPHHAGDRTYCIEPARFAAHLRALADAGQRPIAIEDFLQWLEHGSPVPQAGAFVLTFDDGYADVHEHAWPLLRELGWPATVFLVAGLVGDHDRWMQAPGVSRPPTPLLDLAQIAEMAAGGWSFHSHSMHHRSLTALAGDALVEELAGSRERLRALLGSAVDCLAYPYGHHDSQVVAAVRAAGYRAAFSVQPGFNRRHVDRYRIRRLDVFGQDSPRELLRKIRFGSNDGSLATIGRYYWNRLRGAAG